MFKLLVGMGALLLNQRIPYRNALTGVILLPWVAPPVVVAYVWNWLYEPTFGAFNYLIVHVLGLSNQGVLWLADPQLAMASVVGTTVWRGFPIFTVMILAGRKGSRRSSTRPLRSTGPGAGSASSTSPYRASRACC